MFEPKENVLNIHSIEDVFDRLDEVCKNEKDYTDEEFAAKLHQIYDFCNGGEDGGNFYLITHGWSQRICEQRAKKYCKKHKIKLKDYKGVLPYRMFLIDTLEPLDDNKTLEWFKFHFKNDPFLPQSDNDTK